MSATSKDFVNGIGCYVVAKGSVSGDTTKIYFIWEASKGSEAGSYVCCLLYTSPSPRDQA